MDRGYIRETRNGPTVKEQLEKLRAAGIAVDEPYAPVYIDLLPKQRKHRVTGDDKLPERAKAITDLREGSRLIVSSLDRLGASAIDIKKAFNRVDAKNCSVFDASAGMEYARSTPHHVVDDAAAAAETVLRRENITKARKVLKQRVDEGAITMNGGNKGWSPDAKTKAEAKRDWLENVHITQSQMEEKYGVKRSTLRRHFGERGMPRGRPKSKPST